MTMQAYFFDMDGTLFDSMPHHAQAWDEVTRRHGLSFTPQECYREEGRTGIDILQEIFRREQEKGNPTEIDTLSPDEQLAHIRAVYQEKSARFKELGPIMPVEGAYQLLQYLHALSDTQIWIVTGSAQQSLFRQLDDAFPGIFTRERMITADDVRHGKPSPEPYLIAWQRTGLPKSDCCVIENAPLGVRSAKAAGLFTYAVNTGNLPVSALQEEGADCVVGNMAQLLQIISKTHTL